MVRPGGEASRASSSTVLGAVRPVVARVSLHLDRSLAHRMVVDPGGALVVRSVIELGHSLGLRTVAEGVEDAATGRLLAELGCDVAQGYHFSRPMPADRLVAWYAARHAVAPEPVRV